MGLQISFNMDTTDSCSCDSLTFTETTGAYSGTNTGGWGAPNPILGDVNTATLTIVNNTTNVTYDDLTITASTSSSTVINPSDLNITKFSDGAYCFTYTVTLNNTTVYTYSKCLLLVCNIKCQIKTVAGTLLDTCKHCKYEDYQQLFEIWALYNALTSAANCSDYNQINTNLEILQDKLDNINCKNC